MRGWLIGIAIIAVVSVGVFIFRDRLSSSANDLEVGNCFDEPAVQTEIEDVQRHPCTEPHTAEVIFVGTMTGSGDAYPPETEIDTYSEANCFPAYEAYTGKDLESDTEMTIGWFYPTPTGWTAGDRVVTCYAVRVDGTATSQSVRKAP